MSIDTKIIKGKELGQTDFLWTEKEVINLLTFMNTNGIPIKYLGANHWIDEEMYKSIINK